MNKASTALAPILTIDSGVGGLSVFRHIIKDLPNHRHIYVADDRGFPYGMKAAGDLSDHLFAVISELIAAHAPCLVVIACNTASTLMLETLRMHFPDVLFVGTVPGIKPAVEQSETGLISVLATPGTVERDYTRKLIEKFAADCDVTLVGSNRLAELAETYMANGEVDERAVAAELAPCFVTDESGKRTDIVVLACTHYPFLLPVFEKLAPWPVRFIDPALAIARRVADLAPRAAGSRQKPVYKTTSGKSFAFVDIV